MSKSLVNNRFGAGGRLAWYAETDPHARTVLAAHWPHVPNLGDIRTVDWTRAEPVDILTAGFPGQDYPERSVIPISGRWRVLLGSESLFARDN